MVKKILAVILMTIGLSAAASAQTDGTLVLKAGTPVTMLTTQRLSSQSSSVGGTVNLMVKNDVLTDGTVVIPSGTIVKGYIYDAGSATVLGIGGKVGFDVDGLYATDGTFVPLTGASVYEKGDDNMVLAILCGCFTVLGFLINGDAAEIPSGTEVQGMVMANTYLNAARL